MALPAENYSLGSLPYGPLPPDFSFGEMTVNNARTVIKNFNRQNILSNICARYIPTASELAKYGVTQCEIAFDSLPAASRATKITPQRAIFLNLQNKILCNAKASYIIFEYVTSERVAKKICTMCMNNFEGDNASHIEACVVVFDKNFTSSVCPSCKTPPSSSYTESSHYCSNSHYNNHFRGLVFSDLGKVLVAHSLQHPVLIFPSLVPIVSLIIGVTHRRPQVLATYWLDHLSQYRINVGRQTFDYGQDLTVLDQTVAEFGDLPVPCDLCHNGPSRIGSISTLGLVRALESKHSLKTTPAVCSCGNPTVLYRQSYTKLITEQNSQVELPVVQTASNASTVVKATVSKTQAIAKDIQIQASIAIRGSLFVAADIPNSKETNDAVCSYILKTDQSHLNSVIRRYIKQNDAILLLIASRDQKLQETLNGVIRKISDDSPEMIQLFDQAKTKIITSQ